MPRIPLLSLALLAVAGSHAVAQAPAVTYLTPAGLQRGTTADITAGGTLGDWPVSVWIDRPGVAIVAGEKKGTLAVTAADDASPGLYLARIFSPAGASALRPLLVGTLPESSEQEPNDRLDEATEAALPTVMNAALAKRGDVDCYRVTLKQGQTLVAVMDAHRSLGSPMDAVLQLVGERGVVLVQSDDERGRDPAILFTAPSDGTWELRTFAFPSKPNSSVSFAGADTFVYRLTLTTDGYVDHALPLALNRHAPGSLTLFGWNLPADQRSLNKAPLPADDSEGAEFTVPFSGLAGELRTPYTSLPSVVAPADCSPERPLRIEWPVIVSGQIEAAEDVDAFTFSAVKGQAVELAAAASSLGFPLDPVLRVVNAEGAEVAKLDDSARERDPTLLFRPPADGEYRVEIFDLHRHGGLRCAYRLTVAEPAADFSLTVATDSFVVTAGKPVEIPVTVTRGAGFKLPVVVSAAALPAGVTAEPVTSEPTGATAKSVKLKLTAAAGTVHAGPLKILGTAGEGEEQLIRQPTTALAETGLLHSHLWLTVPPAKEAKQPKADAKPAAP